jgi:hypothetical protein
MADQNKQERTCRNCGHSIVSFNGEESGRGGDVYCGQCLIEQAEKYIKETASEVPRIKRLRETTAGKVFLALIIFTCLIIIAYQYPRIISFFGEKKPVLTGAYVTDTVTDACLKNLVQLVNELQQGKDKTTSILVCPASGKTYMIITGPNPEIHCPNPEIHGFRDLAISKNNPVPELKR